MGREGGGGGREGDGTRVWLNTHSVYFQPHAHNVFNRKSKTKLTASTQQKR